MSKNPYQKLLAHPLEIWQYYLDHKDRLAEGFQHLVAQVGDKTIYITTDGGVIILNIYADGGDEVTNILEADDESSLLSQYNRALRIIGYTVSGFEDPDDDDDEPDYKSDDIVIIADDDEYGLYQEEVSASEGRMNDLCTELVYEFMGDDDVTSTKVVEDCAIAIKELVCQVMANQFRIPVERPMILVAKNGERYYTEHPYIALDQT